MLETIQEFAVVNSTIVKIEKSLINLIFLDRMPEIDTIFVFFDGGIFDDYIARKA